jgi:O-antigen/teichoic acid export membrane protein
MIKKIIYNAGSTAINTLSGLLRNKISAAFLSLNLFGILAIGQQSASLLFLIAAVGIPLGVSTLVAQYAGKAKEEQGAVISGIVALVLVLALAVACVIAIVLMFFAPSISWLVTSDASYSLAITILLFSAPFMLIENSLYSILEGMGRLREIVAFKVIPSLVILPVTYVLTREYSLPGAAASVVVYEFLLGSIAVILLRSEIRLDRQSFRIGVIGRKIFKVALLSFIVGVSALAADFVMKRYILGTLGAVENGIVQGVAKITDLYPTIALSWLSMHLLPALGGSWDDRERVASVLERTAIAAVAIIVPIVLVLFCFRPLILELVYKSDFTVAAGYFGAMLVTGLPKVISWVYGVGLISAGLRRQWFYSSLFVTVVFLAAAWAGLVANLGITALPVAVGCGTILQVAYELWIYRSHGIRFSRANTRLMLLCGAITLSLVAACYTIWAVIAAILLYLLFLILYGIPGYLRSIYLEKFREISE